MGLMQLASVLVLTILFFNLQRTDGERSLAVLLTTTPTDSEFAAKVTLNQINSGGLAFATPDNYSLLIATDKDSSLVQQVCGFTSKRIWGLIDLSDRATGTVDLARRMRIPVVSRRWSKNAISITPRISDILDAVLSILARDNVTRPAIAVITGQKADIPTKILIKSTLVRVFIIPVLSNNQKRIDLLMDIARSTGVLDWIVIANTSQVNSVLALAKQRGLTSASNRWFFAFTYPISPASLCPSGCGLNQVLLLQPEQDSAKVNSFVNSVTASKGSAITKPQSTVIYSSLALETMVRLLNSSTTSSLELPSTGGLSCNISMNGTGSKTEEFNTQSLSLLFQSLMGPTAFSKPSYDFDITININNFLTTSKALSKIGSWSKRGGLSLTGSASFLYPSKRTYNVLVIQEPPFIIRYTNGTFGGYSIDVLVQLSQKLNFDYVIMEQADSIYGTRSPNGTWTGAMHSLVTGKVDILLGAFLITSTREKDVDFTIPYADFAGLQLMGRKSKKVSARGNLAFFIHAFDWTLWLAFFAVVGTTGFFIWFIDRYSPYSYINRFHHKTLEEGEIEGKIFTLRESYWFVLGAVTQAGETFDPRSISARILVIGFWFFAYLLMALYTANLAAQLTADKLTTSRPDSLDTFSAQTKYKFTVIRNSAEHEYLLNLAGAEKELFRFWRERSVKSDVIGWNHVGLDVNGPAATWRYPVTERATKILQQMNSWGLVNTTAEAIKKVKEDDWTVLLDTPLIKYYVANDCFLQAIGEMSIFRPYGIAVRKKSPLKRRLDLIIGELQRDRIIEQIRSKWWSSEGLVCDSNTVSTQGLGMDTLGGAFIFLGSGLAFAFIVFILELIVAKKWGTEWAKDFLNDDPTIVNHQARSAVNLRSGRSSTVGHIHRLSVQSIGHNEVQEARFPHEIKETSMKDV